MSFKFKFKDLNFFRISVDELTPYGKKWLNPWIAEVPEYWVSKWYKKVFDKSFNKNFLL